jgi:hypothetical protein
MIMNFGDGDEASLDVGSQKYHLVVMDISLVLPMLIIYFEYGSKCCILVSCAVYKLLLCELQGFRLP